MSLVSPNSSFGSLASEGDAGNELHEQPLSTPSKNSEKPEAPLPDFSSPPMLKSCYMSSILFDLAKKNYRRLRHARPDYMRFLTPDSVESIFTFCVRMRLPHEVKYLAAVIFDRYSLLPTKMNNILFVCRLHFLTAPSLNGWAVWFMCDQVEIAFQFIDQSLLSAKRKEREWERVEANLSSQLLLRAISSIQVASKMVDYFTSISSTQVTSVLRPFGQTFTTESVINSELRILKMLNFEMPMNPIVYPETMLSYVGFAGTPIYIKVPDLRKDDLWQFILSLMDMVFLSHDELYELLLKDVMGDRYNELAYEDMVRIKQDYMLLGAGVVVAAVVCAHGAKYLDQASRQLSEMSGTPEEDVRAFAVTLLHVVQSNDTNEDHGKK